MNNEVIKPTEQNPQGYGPSKPEILDLAHRAEIPVKETVWKDGTKVIAFQTRLEDFYFMGIENKYDENTDFGDFWGNFFDKGGYDPIDPYAIDPNCINVWLNRSADEKIYYQGKMAREDAIVPEGYTMKKFPGGEYLVVTTEWMATYEETMKHIRFEYFESMDAPDGYVKCTEQELGVWLLERWGANTGEGYRYEFWVPLKRK